MRKVVITAIAILGIASMASAGVITAGSITLSNGQDLTKPTAGPVAITLSGGDQIGGAELYVQIGDGAYGPMITAANFVSAGNVFNPGNSPGDQDQVKEFPGLIYATGTVTTAGTVPATGTLANLMIDATGVTPGVYDLLLSIPAYELSSNFAGTAPATLVNGLITVTPEPAALALLGLGGLFIRRRHA